MYDIRADHETHGDVIRQFLQREFPHATTAKADRVDNVTQILVGSLQRRLGPVPKPESMGYFKISSTDAVCPAQVDWNEVSSLDLTESCVTFSDDRESVHIRADMLLTAR